MTIEERTYHIMGTTSILGSSPANPAVRSAYLASKAKDPTGLSEEESAYLPDDEQKGITVFLQDDKDASCMYLDYQIRGFFKSALNALEYDNKIKQAKSKVDKYLFIAPRKIHILKDGKRVYDTDEDCERSLRADTMQGPRTTVAASEQINAPWEMTFTVRLIQNSGSKSSAALMFEAIEDALDYGQLCGLGQWRNGGHGRFTWERVDKEDKTQWPQTK